MKETIEQTMTCCKCEQPATEVGIGGMVYNDHAETEHTPGPWFIDGMGNDPYCVAITAGELIDGPDFQRERKLAEVHTKADARLIAAAPELLEALQDLDRVATALLAGKYEGRTEIGHSDLSISARNARAAIAKATT
jgi:hypothetical protein